MKNEYWETEIVFKIHPYATKVTYIEKKLLYFYVILIFLDNNLNL